MKDRYRVTLTLADGTLLVWEGWDEAVGREWARQRGEGGWVKGRLMERIVTLVID